MRDSIPCLLDITYKKYRLLQTNPGPVTAARTSNKIANAFNYERSSSDHVETISESFVPAHCHTLAGTGHERFEDAEVAIDWTVPWRPGCGRYRSRFTAKYLLLRRRRRWRLETTKQRCELGMRDGWTTVRYYLDR